MRVYVGDKFWGVASDWHDKKICLMVELLTVVATHICLNWTMYWYITLNVFNVNYINNIYTRALSYDTRGHAGVFIVNFKYIHPIITIWFSWLFSVVGWKKLG